MDIKYSIARRRLVYGVGVNDASYITQPTGAYYRMERQNANRYRLTNKGDFHEQS